MSKRFFSVLILLTLLGSLVGCDNRRSFIKGNLVAIADIEKPWQSPKYYVVIMGRPKEPYQGTPAFTVRLPAGNLLYSGQLSVERVKKDSLSSEPAHKIDSDWPDKATMFIIEGGINVIIDDNRIVCIQMGDSMGNATGTKIYDFPLTEKQLIELFGSPDRVNNWTFH